MPTQLISNKNIKKILPSENDATVVNNLLFNGVSYGVFFYLS